MISLNPELCTDCLECRNVCPDYVFAVTSADGRSRKLHLRYPEQCCACGHCIAVCPSAALSHPDLPPEGFVPLAQADIEPEEMQALLLSRRSIRHYRPETVPDEKIEMLLLGATHAGTSSNGQTEGFIVIRDRATLKRLELLVVDTLWRAGFRFLGGTGIVSRLLARKYGPELIRQYRPYHGIFKHRRENGELEGAVFRNAPVVIVAHGLRANQLAGANCALALRNVELLAATMGLGTCWVGFLVAAASRSRKIGDGIGLERDRQILGALMLGYPGEQYHASIPRKPRPTRWI